MAQKPSPELTCQEILAALSEYVDGELTPDMMGCISKHISNCAPCVEFVESLRHSMQVCGNFAASCKPSPLSDEVVLQLKTAYQRAFASCAGQHLKPKLNDIV